MCLCACVCSCVCPRGEDEAFSEKPDTEKLTLQRASVALHERNPKLSSFSSPPFSSSSSSYLLHPSNCSRHFFHIFSPPPFRPSFRILHERAPLHRTHARKLTPPALFLACGGVLKVEWSRPLVSPQLQSLQGPPQCARSPGNRPCLHLSCEGPVHDTHLPFIVLIIHVTTTSLLLPPPPPPTPRSPSSPSSPSTTVCSSRFGFTLCSRYEAAELLRAVRVRQPSHPRCKMWPFNFISL